jgi:hypothetical protein
MVGMTMPQIEALYDLGYSRGVAEASDDSSGISGEL